MAHVSTMKQSLRQMLQRALINGSKNNNSLGTHHRQIPRLGQQLLHDVTTTKPIICRHFSRTSFMPSGTVPITYVEADGTEKTVVAEIGQNMMQVAHDNDIELEGACGGELACSTCHLIFEQDIYDTLDEKEEEEDDMLDLAFEVTETSRLGCQILVKEHFAGTKVKIPDDGF